MINWTKAQDERHKALCNLRARLVRKMFSKRGGGLTEEEITRKEGIEKELDALECGELEEELDEFEC